MVSAAAILVRLDARDARPYPGAEAVVAPGVDYSAEAIYNDALTKTAQQFSRACASMADVKAS